MFLTLLIDNGFVRVSSLSNSKKKIRYTYLLSLKGIREKSLIATKFLIQKKEYKLEKKIGLHVEGWKCN